MNRKIVYGIRFKVVLAFGVLFLAVGLISELLRYYGMPYTVFKGEENAIKQQAFDNFSVFADTQKERLADWIEERKTNLNALADSVTLRQRIETVSVLFRKSQAEGMTGEGLWGVLKKEKPFQDLLNDLAMRKQRLPFFQGLALIDGKSGIVIAAIDQEKVGKKVFEEKELSSRKGPDDFLVSISAEGLEHNQANLMMVRRVLPDKTQAINRDAPQVFLAGFINLQTMVMPLLNVSRTLRGSAEIVLVDEKRRLLIPLKHALKNGRVAVPMEYTISAEPSARAARGEEGIIEDLDYRGVPVLAAYRHLSFSAHKGIGMVVKCDRSEVLSYFERRKTVIFFTNLIGVLIGGVLLFLLASKITQPIRTMSELAQHAEEHNYSGRVNELANDETGILAQAFNKMMSRIETWKTEMEQQVQSRTAELSAVNQQLRASEQQLRASNQQLRASQQQLRASNQQLVAKEQRLSIELEHREKIEEETRKHLHEMQVFFKSSMGREERILELKNKIRELEEQLKKK